MDKLETIQNDCRQATFLIEKKQIQPITMSEESQLRIHLMGCSICRIYQIQSVLINQMAKAIDKTSSTKERLDEYTKNQMQQIIEEKIGDNRKLS